MKKKKYWHNTKTNEMAWSRRKDGYTLTHKLYIMFLSLIFSWADRYTCVYMHVRGEEQEKGYTFTLDWLLFQIRSIW